MRHVVCKLYHSVLRHFFNMANFHIHLNLNQSDGFQQPTFKSDRSESCKSYKLNSQSLVISACVYMSLQDISVQLVHTNVHLI